MADTAYRAILRRGNMYIFSVQFTPRAILPVREWSQISLGFQWVIISYNFCVFWYGSCSMQGNKLPSIPRGGMRKWEEDKTMKISARNQLKGKIKNITKGAVNSEVTLELTDGLEIISITTNSSVNTLGLKEGKEAYAVIKASNVMIATD